ncbi:MAG: kinase [Rhodanobacteraceae bacterium]
MPRNASTQAGYDRTTVEPVLDALIARMPKRRAALVGLSGLQGSGKSTLARQLAHAARDRGIPTQVLALDDFYLGRRERATLARTRHLLLAARGVPGTHDIALLDRTLREFANASTNDPVRIPRFDKGRDTRDARSRWRRVAEPPRLILLEGWCIGVPAAPRGESTRALNALERREDADGRWRAHVEAALANEYARLWRKLDALVMLAAPSFAVVERWRDEPERALRSQRAPHAMSPAALRRFLMHYERLSRRALKTLPSLADIVIELDERRRVRRLNTRG